MKIKYLVIALASCLAVGCVEEDRDAQIADQQKIDTEVHTPQQTNYETIDQCKAEFPQDGDCVASSEPEQKSFSSEDECKKNAPDPTMCQQQTPALAPSTVIAGTTSTAPIASTATTTTTTTNNGGGSNALLWYYVLMRPHYVSPPFYPWGAVYHNNGSYSYNQHVPATGRPIASSTLAARNVPSPNFNNASSYASSRTSSLSASRSSSSVSRGGFGSTGAHASSGGGGVGG